IFGAECGCNDRAGRKPCIAFEHDEPPGRELAKIRHAARDGQKLVDFGSGRAGCRQRDGFAGSSGGKEFNSVRHGVPNKRTFVNSARCPLMQRLAGIPKARVCGSCGGRSSGFPLSGAVCLGWAVGGGRAFKAGEGHWITSALVMLFAYAVSLFVTHWLFVVVKPKLLTLPWFARAWSWFVAARDK